MNGWGFMGRCAALGCVVVVAAGWAIPAQAAEHKLAIEVLSNRADLISGGAALVAVELPDAAVPNGVTVKLNGADVTSQFAQRPDGRFEALLTGLEQGPNALAATGAGKRDAVTIVN